VIVRGSKAAAADFIAPETFSQKLLPQRRQAIGRLKVGADGLATHRAIERVRIVDGISAKNRTW
jgi:hypothetical protein